MCSDTSLSDLTINFDNISELDNLILLEHKFTNFRFDIRITKKKYYQ